MTGTRHPRSTRRGLSRLLLVTAGSALLALPACATKGDLRNLRTEMAGLQQGQDEAFQQLERRLAVLMDSVELTLELQRNAQGQTASQVRSLGQDVQQLRNLVDDTQSRLERLLGEFARLDQLIDRMEALANRGGLGGGGAATPPPSGGSADAQEAYEVGMQYLNDGSFATARVAFQTVLEEHARDPYAPLAQLKVAETYVGERRLEDAYRAFEVVWDRWENADVVPEALFRAGFVAAEAGENRRARGYWERLVRDHEGTEFARMAEDGLRRIGG